MRAVLRIHNTEPPSYLGLVYAFGRVAYDKEPYMPDELKDKNGKAYAYRDAAGNYCEPNFGLHY